MLEAQSLQTAELNEPSYQQVKEQVHYLTWAGSSWNRNQAHHNYMNTSWSTCVTKVIIDSHTHLQAEESIRGQPSY